MVYSLLPESIRGPSSQEMNRDEGTDQMWKWYETASFATASQIAQKLSELEPGPKHKARFEQWIELWNNAKTRVDIGFEPALVALQMAAAQELGLSLPFLRREQTMPSVQKALNTYQTPMRAFVRALYAFTQSQLAEHGVEGTILWRGIKRSQGYPFPYPERFSLGYVANNPLASFTLSLRQAGQFALSDIGALNCAYVPASRIIGTPFTGLGVLSQREAVSLGASAAQEDQCFWLVWHGQDLAGETARALKWQNWRDLIEKYETDTMKDES